MYMIAHLLTSLISIVILIIFLQVVLHWLIAFEVIHARTPQAQNLLRVLNDFTNRMYAPLRKFIPPMGGIDITPIVTIIGLQLLSSFIWQVSI